MSDVKLLSVNEVPPGQGKAVTIGDKNYAAFNIGGTFHVIDNVCPHRGGPLTDGDIEGTIVTCPWHRWEFDVTTGKSPVNPAACVKVYPCKVVGSDLIIEG